MIECLTLNKQPVLENRLNIVTVISDDRASDSKQTPCSKEQTQHCHGDIK